MCETSVVVWRGPQQTLGLHKAHEKNGTYAAGKRLRDISSPDMFLHRRWMQVHSIVSKMMMEEQLSGRWDQPTRTIVMHSTRATRVQSLALTLAEKTANLVDLNERALTLRTGGLRDEGADEGRGYEQPGFPGQRRCLPSCLTFLNKNLSK